MLPLLCHNVVAISPALLPAIFFFSLPLTPLIISPPLLMPAY